MIRYKMIMIIIYYYRYSCHASLLVQIKTCVRRICTVRVKGGLLPYQITIQKLSANTVLYCLCFLHWLDLDW